MCGRYTSTADVPTLLRLFDVDELDADPDGDDLAPNPNVAPTEPVPAVLERYGRRTLRALRWGLVPSWARDTKGRHRLINARAETAADRPAFRSALRHRRCLLPAQGYYEWRRAPGGAAVPHLLAPASGGTLAFAGLFEAWRDPAQPAAEPLRTCTILTTAAAPDIAWLHARMPVILPPDAWDEWLDRDHHEVAALRHLLGPAPEGTLRVTLAPPAVNDPRNKDIGDAGQLTLRLPP